MCHKKNCLQQPALLLEPVTEKLLKRLFYHAISRLTQLVLLVGLVSAGFFYHDHLRHSMKKVTAAGIPFFFKKRKRYMKIQEKVSMLSVLHNHCFFL
jgi:hypothetical protein